MLSTMDLLARIKEPPFQDWSNAKWCEHLDVNRTALTVARTRGRLSPTLAGNIARLLGEDVEKWIAIAALEAEPNTYIKNKLLSRIASVYWCNFLAHLPRPSWRWRSCSS